MFHGRLQQFDSPNTFYERPARVSIARFFGGVNFLPGVKRGAQVQTALGLLNVNLQEIADGPVVVTIRPENIGLGNDGENAVPGRILSHVYVGTHTRFRVRSGEHEFEIVADAASVERFRDGQTLSLQLSRDRIWLVTPED